MNRGVRTVTLLAVILAFPASVALGQPQAPQPIEILVPSLESPDKDEIAKVIAAALQGWAKPVSLRKSNVMTAYQHLLDPLTATSQVLLISEDMFIAPNTPSLLDTSVPIGCIGTTPWVITVNKNAGVPNFTKALETPGLRFGVPGYSREPFHNALNVKVHTPWTVTYPPEGEPYADFLYSGGVDLTAMPFSAFLSRAALRKRYNAVALAADRQHPVAPQLKTLAQFGHDFSFVSTFAVYARPGTSLEAAVEMSTQLKPTFSSAAGIRTNKLGISIDYQDPGDCLVTLIAQEKIVAVARGLINPFDVAKISREGTDLWLEFTLKERAEVYVLISNLTIAQRVHESARTQYVPGSQHRMSLGAHLRRRGTYLITVYGKSSFGSTWFPTRIQYEVK